MAALYDRRLKNYQKKMFRYLKYVFNDHFSLILIVLMGGFMFFYSEMIKQIDQSFYYGKLLVGLIWLLTLFVGQLSTIVEEADKVFLLPKEKEMTRYLEKAFRHSLVLPALFLLLIVALSQPLLMAIAGVTVVDGIFFLLTMWCLKICHLFLKYSALYHVEKKEQQQALLVFFIVSAAVITVMLVGVSWAGLILSSIFLHFSKNQVKRLTQNSLLDWETMIQKEKHRQKKIFQFINLFTDVPGMSSSVRRRKYFDPLLRKIKASHQRTYLYLYARSFLRGTEYSGVFARLLLVAVILMSSLNQLLWLLPVALLALFVICFQLLPLYGQFDYMVMTQLYPVPSSQKQNNLQQLLMILLGGAGVLFSLVSLIVLPDWRSRIIAVGVILLMSLLLILIYVPTRIKKMDSM
ncbi:ABC transporter permease [Vagococcus elongatus]|uniref:Multidrug ABC transporter permease n=1 Tax=Vagococcus elongatus TaxID=180344 RepID=A0A430AMP3_9ENTE|nr:ABC transporter permease [Vagococcus elongatus]RSU09177.1 hypothetical protein CBF29_11960 [Vagococcus elongatus]